MITDIPKGYIEDTYWPDISFDGHLSNVIEMLQSILAKGTEAGWINLYIDTDYGFFADDPDTYKIIGHRAKTEKELEKEKKARARQREKNRKAKEAREAKERAELERLQKKYG